MIIHVVKQGDSIYKIAQEYGVSPDTIISANGLKNPEHLVVGQAIVIPGDFSSMTIRQGQNLYSIAQSLGLPPQSVIEANPRVNPNRLQARQSITLPIQMQKMKSIYVNGFAIPGIAPEVLQSTLPHLSFMSIFSYQVRSDGNLKSIDDMSLVQTARDAKVAPMMVITNIEEGSGFSSEIANDILTNMQVQNTLIANVISVLEKNGYFGLVIDFEYIYPEDRQNYVNFVSRMVNSLRPMGYKVAVALAPKTDANQKGLLYEAHDYPAIGALADFVILMTYEWGYLRGPAEAVAPIDKVRKVLDYATGVIPSEKILMGMPNYGYDWTLPFVKGSAARVLTNDGAVSLALSVGANIMYDNVAQAPFFNYYAGDRKRHEVWFDDARSYYARLKLIDIYNLGGVSYWTINKFFAPNWLVLDSMYNVKKVL